MPTHRAADEMSWKIEQDGEVICSDPRDRNREANKVFTKDCCIDYEKEYTITCEDSANDGWDYFSYYSNAQIFDGYLMVGDIKYCDVFGGGEISYTISRTNFFLNILDSYLTL